MLDLSNEFARLNEEQRAAVLHNGHTAVLAGPGSGKTATLVLKIAHLLASELRGPQRIACITFNNDTVEEFRQRLASFGIYAGRRLFLGTLHSFCLNSVLRPYAQLSTGRYSKGVNPAHPGLAGQLLERAIEKHMPGERPSWQVPTITRYRRAIGCGEDTGGFDDRVSAVVSTYEAALEAQGVVDFEQMVLIALELLRAQPWAGDLVASRYAWLLVDEYQDLGGPLHQIVVALATAGVRVFAVGDADQTIYDFTGADPAYLRALAARPDVEPFRLRFNYRSGQKLIDASQVGLGEHRGYQAAPGREAEGRVEFFQAAETNRSHAAKTVEAIRAELAGGTRGHEIAVLYRSKNVMLAELEDAFKDAGIEYTAERSSLYPSSPITRWFQSAARWASHRDQLFEDVHRYYRTLLEAAGDADCSAEELHTRRLLAETLEASTRHRDLPAWLDFVDGALSIREAILSANERPDQLEAFDDLKQAATNVSTQQFSLDCVAEGKVVLTTLHSSKGRQFDAVVIPGLVEGLMPTWSFNRRSKRYEEPTPSRLAEDRRLFYVGFTRARHVVYLVYADSFSNQWYTNKLGCGVSRFAIEIGEQISSPQ